MMHPTRRDGLHSNHISRRVLADLFPETFAGIEGFDPALLYAECGQCGRPLVWPLRATTLILKKAGVDPVTLDYTHMLRASGCGECSEHPDDITITLVRLVGDENTGGGRERH